MRLADGILEYPDSLTLPRSLAKACQDDNFEYALQLRTGQVIRFTGASISGEFAHLTAYGGNFPELPYPCPRGIDVRISDIVWCADAPTGS